MFTASPSRVPSIEAPPSYGDSDDEITAEEAQMVSQCQLVVKQFLYPSRLLMKFRLLKTTSLKLISFVIYFEIQESINSNDIHTMCLLF